MSFPATTHNASGSHQEEFSSPQHANAFTTQQGTHLADNNELEMYHVRNMIKNESVSIQVSASGWIIFTAISLMKFMGKSTGTEVKISYLKAAA